MKICITVGHSLLKNGCYTSADGSNQRGCNEYKWNKAFSRQLTAALKKKGHYVTRIICPERKFINSSEEKVYKLGIINNGTYDLVIELHCNAGTETAHGCEVLYKSDKGREYAKSVQKALSEVFTDRGVKQRDDLYILNGTEPTAVLVETFFCTSKADYKLAKGIFKRTKIAKLVAKAI